MHKAAPPLLRHRHYREGLIEMEEYLAGKAKVIENFATGNLQLSLSPALPSASLGAVEGGGAAAVGTLGAGPDNAGGSGLDMLGSGGGGGDGSAAAGVVEGSLALPVVPPASVGGDEA